ncbi:hypothetical protein IWX90DRAFT_484554 [Phyllosticta citrichinensis]|uniref:Uncharacterized protein n=1 Tax=Phyllosticta citrichinensis TaxID=1130410 RepID=A0ABR1XZ74_9PEZI
MPRAVKDATMFTATGPYAHSKATNVPLNQAPAGQRKESPQEKIARLRAAAQQAKVGQESQFDRYVSKGRAFADKAHRFTTLSLIAFTGVAGIVSALAVTDMIIYNRKKKREWFHEQKQKHAIALAEARLALTDGTITHDQMLLLNRERAAEEAEAIKRNKKGIFTRAKESMFGGLSKEEQTGGKLAATTRDNAGGEGVLAAVQDAATHGKETIGESSIARTLEEKRREGEKAQPLTPGPLDRMADDATQAATQKSKSWTSWITGR